MSCHMQERVCLVMAARSVVAIRFGQFYVPWKLIQQCEMSDTWLNINRHRNKTTGRRWGRSDGRQFCEAWSWDFLNKSGEVQPIYLAWIRIRDKRHKNKLIITKLATTTKYYGNFINLNLFVQLPLLCQQGTTEGKSFLPAKWRKNILFQLRRSA